MTENKIKKRDRSLDLFKGFLIIQMTLAHVLAFYGNGDQLWYWVSQAVNLSTFGGFLFAFGWGAQIAWLPKDFKIAAPRMLKAALRLHVSFLVSAICYLTLIDGKPYEPKMWFDILTFQDIPSYSQFLGSFTIATLLGILFFKFWKNMGPWIGLALGMVCALSTLIPTFHELIPLAYFWSPISLGTFPFFQYAHYWIAGILLARYKLFDRKILGLIAVFASAPVLYYAIQEGTMPREYGPSIYWITGGYLIHWIYLRSSLLLDRWNLAEWLSEMGSKALYFLLGTNFLIFALRGHLPKSVSFGECSIYTVAILAFLYWLAYLVKRG